MVSAKGSMMQCVEKEAGQQEGGCCCADHWWWTGGTFSAIAADVDAAAGIRS
jgi:hypothetical protein